MSQIGIVMAWLGKKTAFLGGKKHSFFEKKTLPKMKKKPAFLA